MFLSSKNVAALGLTLSLLIIPIATSATSPYSDDGSDRTRPLVGLVTPTTVTVNTAETYTADVSDSGSGLAFCRFYVNNNDMGAMDFPNSSTTTFTYTFTEVGIHTIFVFCKDNVGNMQSGDNASIWVKAAAGDTTPPQVGSVSSGLAIVGASTYLEAAYSDVGTGVKNCDLLVSGFSRGAMALTGSKATVYYAFPSAGNFPVAVMCTDSAGNTSTGSTVSLAVGEVAQLAPSSQESYPPPAASSTSGLIKAPCPENAGSNHACRTVYYYGADGRRHPFPNERVYFTWYSDFSGVTTISESAMAGYSLGKTVIYRPGAR
ncbi:MAG: hypothetical protein V1821_01325, partial [bacterium]